MTKRPMSRPKISSLGGKARKAKLSPARRKAIARLAAKARWAQVAQNRIDIDRAFYSRPPQPTTGGDKK